MLNMKPSRILIVDDNLENLNVLFELLDEKGYDVLTSKSGESALKRAGNTLPGLILLDVLMPPGIDGFETCRQLKENKITKDIPVIFMTALSDTLDKLKGFELGAMDYITKPFDTNEVLARVKTHLTMVDQKKQLEKQNNDLIKLNAEKDDLIGIVAHDLKSPLTGISLLAALIERGLGNLTEEDVINKAQKIQAVVNQMSEIIKHILEMNRLESEGMNPTIKTIDLCKLVRSCIHIHDYYANCKEITLHYDSSHDCIECGTDRILIREVIDNLISNAIKFSPPQKSVSIRLVQDKASVRVEIKDEGQGLTDSDKQKLFKKFARLTAKPTAGENSTGLGLAIVKKLVDSLNGKIWAESEGSDKGATFYLELPKVVGLE